MFSFVKATLLIFRNPVIFLNGHGLFPYFSLRCEK